MINRRRFIASTGAILAGVSASKGTSADEAFSIRQAVENYYAAYRGLDKAKYRALLTEDYRLLENGELLDANGDLAAMAAHGSGYQRQDTFDFRLIRVQGDSAYAVYFLTSDIKDLKGTRHREWLESIVLRRSGAAWLVALLHSTPVPKPGK